MSIVFRVLLLLTFSFVILKRLSQTISALLLTQSCFQSVNYIPFNVTATR